MALPLAHGSKYDLGMNAHEGLKAACAKLSDLTSLGALLDKLHARIMLQQDLISIVVDPAKLLEQLACSGAAEPSAPIIIAIAVALRRRGHELKLVYAAPDARPTMRDDRLIQLLGQARVAYEELRPRKPTGISRRHAVRLARLNCLAPNIVTTILEGRQPIEFTTRALLRIGDLPNGGGSASPETHAPLMSEARLERLIFWGRIKRHGQVFPQVRRGPQKPENEMKPRRSLSTF